MVDAQRSLAGLFPDELEQLVVSWGEPAYRGRQIFRNVHRRGVLDPRQMTDLPAALRERLTLVRSEEVRRLRSVDGLTSKLLLKLHDGQEIEAVEMRTAPDEEKGRKTICVSTQAGCAMGCVFCVTGQFGFARNLEAGEVVEQVLRFADPLRPVTNVVFMGMGEPLANYEETVRAIHLLIHPEGLKLGARRITVSTSGLVPAMRRLADEGVQIGLAVSLHAPNDELRSSLMPVNRRWPIRAVLDATEYYINRTGRRVSFEYTLMAGVNDSDALADDLADLLRGRLCHVNLIPLNANEDQTLHASTAQRALSFEGRLRDAGVAATIRVNRGRDILAACGQLRLAEKTRRDRRDPQLIALGV
ncbi:MAG TPA: 23S rRNA (adenine(2503)-C(2))-methyltransferase RlmN [Chloroflexota bacterium]|nr:23S rRNA (adenine(2503)-C(2))-methyltransferase RlmN [Chloroflexota bacterium]